jgi:hypothetical protein
LPGKKLHRKQRNHHYHHNSNYHNNTHSHNAQHTHKKEKKRKKSQPTKKDERVSAMSRLDGSDSESGGGGSGVIDLTMMDAAAGIRRSSSVDDLMFEMERRPRKRRQPDVDNGDDTLFS